MTYTQLFIFLAVCIFGLVFLTKKFFSFRLDACETAIDRKRTLRKKVFTVFLFFCLSLIFIRACNNFFGGSPEPASMPIHLDRSGVVAEFDFEVKWLDSYWFFIDFSYPENNQIERAHVKKTLDNHSVDQTGKPLGSAIPLSFDLSIFALCNTGRDVEIHSVIHHNIGVVGGSFTRNITYKILYPGMYKLRLTNNQLSNDFSSIPTTLKIGISANSSLNPAKLPERNSPCLP